MMSTMSYLGEKGSVTKDYIRSQSVPDAKFGMLRPFPFIFIRLRPGMLVGQNKQNEYSIYGVGLVFIS